LLLQDKVKQCTRMIMVAGFAQKLLDSRMSACVARASKLQERLDSLQLDLTSCQQQIEQLLHRQHELEVDSARVRSLICICQSWLPVCLLSATESTMTAGY
jgi:DNA repair exonuclease SbcCD ATPase subunit